MSLTVEVESAYSDMDYTSLSIKELLKRLSAKELPIRPSLTDLAKHPQPFNIPCPSSGPYTDLFQPFSTSLSETSSNAAWALSSPFNPFPYSTRWELEVAGSGSQSYSEVYTTYERQGTTHLSASLGIGIGNAVLGANVRVQYDRTVTENADGIKLSKKAIVKRGLLSYSTLPQLQPQLSASAIEILAKDITDGTNNFLVTYGDCFVGGLVIGGEAGVLFSQDSFERLTTEVTNVELTVKVLFMKFSKTITTTKEDREFLRDFRISSFDTTSGLYECLGPNAPDGPDGNVELAMKAVRAVDELSETVDRKIKNIFEEEEKQRGIGGLEGRLAHEGLVLEVVLVPYKCLPEYVDVVERTRNLKMSVGVLSAM